jgi:uracil DNA glycosylase superfamily protein
MNFSGRVIRFYRQLEIKSELPENIEVLNPYKGDKVMALCERFYEKYYGDENGRRLILGINPGRFGAGITGIPFTDPVTLENECGIENEFEKRKEISSEFIYKLINGMGGPDHFYKHYYIGSVSPLGFTKNNKNFNYYDSKELLKIMKPEISAFLIKQIGLGINSRKCYCLGQGKNYEYLQYLNAEMKLFDSIVPLPHPRWVMQYRRKAMDSIIEEMIQKLIY